MIASFKNILTQPTVIASVIVGVLVAGVQSLGVLEPVELKAYDYMTQRRTPLGPDPRLFIVAFNESDIQKLKQGSPSGSVLDSVLTKLERYQPKAIGIDFFRDVPVEPGHQKLLEHLRKSTEIVPICRVGGDRIAAVAAPPGVQPDAVGFADIPEDQDVVIRRSLLVVTPNSKSGCKTPASLGFQLALNYLNLQPEFTPEGNMLLGNKLFKRLEPNSGGYHHVDNGGFQILLNYRNESNIAQLANFTDVLSDRIKPSWVNNRIVLIGSTAPSAQDIRNTPYSDGQVNNTGKMPGVIIHAQIVSQILDAVSGERPLFWFFPEWGEILWVWGWTLIGGVIAYRFSHPLRLGLISSAALATLLLSCFVIFTQAGWVPVASPVLGFILADVGVVSYVGFQNRKYKEKIALQIQEQKETIALLQALLKEGGNDETQPPTGFYSEAREKLLNNRYKVTELLGSGGFSYTYLAEDTHRPGNPVCVVKHLQPARKDDVFLEVARRLFKTEAEILDLLGTHDQIPKLMAYFEEKQQFYLVQEYIKGHSLQTELTAGNRMSQTQVVSFLKDVLQVLAFVHSRGVIHRDIKPSNLMRRQTDNRIVLIDFGAVKQIQPQQLLEQSTLHENQTVAVGTVGYAPPEQFMGQPRLNSDIYALGMIGLQALTGVSAQRIERDSTTTAPIWRHLSLEVTDEFVAVLDKMVFYDFLRRYQSADEVLQSLENL